MSEDVVDVDDDGAEEASLEAPALALSLIIDFGRVSGSFLRLPVLLNDVPPALLAGGVGPSGAAVTDAPLVTVGDALGASVAAGGRASRAATLAWRLLTRLSSSIARA